MWYLCIPSMPSIPDDPVIQNVIINAICEKAGGKTGGSVRDLCGAIYRIDPAKNR